MHADFRVPGLPEICLWDFTRPLKMPHAKLKARPPPAPLRGKRRLHTPWRHGPDAGSGAARCRAAVAVHRDARWRPVVPAARLAAIRTGALAAPHGQGLPQAGAWGECACCGSIPFTASLLDWPALDAGALGALCVPGRWDWGSPGCQLLDPLCMCRASAQVPAHGAGVLRPRSETASGSHPTGLPRAQVHQMRAHAVLGLSADPERPGQLTIQMLRTGQALVAPRPRLARRSAATDCADVAGPYSVRSPLQGRVGSCLPLPPRRSRALAGTQSCGSAAPLCFVSTKWKGPVCSSRDPCPRACHKQ